MPYKCVIYCTFLFSHSSRYLAFEAPYVHHDALCWRWRAVCSNSLTVTKKRSEWDCTRDCWFNSTIKLNNNSPMDPPVGDRRRGWSGSGWQWHSTEPQITEWATSNFDECFIYHVLKTVSVGYGCWGCFSGACVGARYTEHASLGICDYNVNILPITLWLGVSLQKWLDSDLPPPTGSTNNPGDKCGSLTEWMSSNERAGGMGDICWAGCLSEDVNNLQWMT